MYKKICSILLCIVCLVSLRAGAAGPQFNLYNYADAVKKGDPYTVDIIVEIHSDSKYHVEYILDDGKRKILPEIPHSDFPHRLTFDTSELSYGEHKLVIVLDSNGVGADEVIYFQVTDGAAASSRYALTSDAASYYSLVNASEPSPGNPNTGALALLPFAVLGAVPACGVLAVVLKRRKAKR